MAKIKKHIEPRSFKVAPRVRRVRSDVKLESLARSSETALGHALDIAIDGPLSFRERQRIMQADEAEAKTRGKITRCLENVELARQRMANDQIEIDRLRLETRALISEMMSC